MMRLYSFISKRIVPVAVLIGLAVSPLLAVTQEEYDALLGRIASECEKALGTDQTRAASGYESLDKLAAELPAELVVHSQTADLTVNLSTLKKDLQDLRASEKAGRTAKTRELLGRVDALRSAMGGASISRSVSVAQARATLDDVLSSRKFKPSGRDILSQKINDFLLSLSERISISERTVKITFWIIAILGGLLFLAALTYAIVMMVRAYTPHKGSAEPVDRSRLKAKPAKRTVESLLQFAEQEAAMGRYREAYRTVYLASLLLLDRAGLVTYSDSGTNWEYLRALKRQAAESADILQSMTMSFDQLIYGKGEVASDNYQSALRQFRQLEAAV